MEAFVKIRDLINKEIKEENEPKETAVLVRVLCLIDIFFLSVHAFLEMPVQGTYVGLGFLAMTVLLWFVFFASYRIKMRHLVFVYYMALVVNAAVLVVMLGLSLMFQAQFYIMFMMFFYRAGGTAHERVMSIFLSAVILLSLVVYVRHFGSYLPVDLSLTMYHAITWICTVYILAKSAAIAYFFRLKFSASEEKIIKYSKKLEMLATTDPLTKLQNRRGMINHIEQYVAGINKGSQEELLTIAIGDIDFFKHINDTYGHEVGDYVLETLAKIMNEFMEGKGMVARWGGEEFLFSLEGINGDYAFEEISKLLHLIERYEFSYEGTPIKVTMTFGLEEYDDHSGIDRVISKADEKLYMGKEQGRNRVIY